MSLEGHPEAGGGGADCQGPTRTLQAVDPMTCNSAQ